MATKREKKRHSSRLKAWMKVILLFLLTLTLLMVYPLILCNLLQKEAQANHTLPLVPFQEKLLFCSLSDEVAGTDYQKGMILLIEPKESYVAGEKVLLLNRYANKQDHSIHNKYNVAVISEKIETGYQVVLSSYHNESMEISAEEAVGKITSRAYLLGFFYNNMQGLRGYILFCAIPLLVIALVYFIMHFAVGEPVLEEAEEEAESIMLPPPEEKPAITIETIRTTPQDDIRDFIEVEEDVKLYQIKTVNKPSPIPPEPIVPPAQPLRQIEQADAVSAPSAPLVVHPIEETPLSPEQRRKFEIMKQTHPDEILKKIAEKNKQLLAETELELQIAREVEEGVVSNEMSQPATPTNFALSEPLSAIEIDDEPVPTEPQAPDWLEADLSKPTMSADEILERYHQSLQEPAFSESDKNLVDIAKLYYDNDIENFQK